MERSIITEDKITLGEYYAGCSNLVCPRCGRDEMHQGTVTVFDRGKEDDDQTVVTTVSGDQTIMQVQTSANCGNPSARRQGLKIAFSCETCSAEAENNGRPEPVTELTIAQHKGITLIGWKFDVLG